MAGRGRTKGFQMGAEHRSKITNSRILSNLIAHAEGDLELSATQVTTGLGLLKKVMPDLTHNQIAGDEDSPVIHKIVRTIVRPGD